MTDFSRQKVLFIKSSKVQNLAIAKYIYTTVYRETFVLLNLCEFHEFNSIVKISLANFLQLWAWQMVTHKI